MALEITPTAATLGATVSGIRLDALDDATFAGIEDAWHAHAVLVFPGQHLSEEAQVAFSERFGPLERRSINIHTRHDPAFIHLSNVKMDGTLWPANSETGLLLEGNNCWHTDSSFKRIPAKASLLSARIVPETGGETAFADMRAAYDALEPAMQDWLAGRIAVHSYAYSQGKVGGTRAITEKEWEALPPVEQPVIRTHPATGRRNLYFGRHASPHRGRGRAGKPPPAGAALRGRLQAAPRLRSPLVRGRPGAVGQPLRAAPGPRLSRRPAAPHGPHHRRRRQRRRQRMGLLSRRWPGGLRQRSLRLPGRRQ